MYRAVERQDKELTGTGEYWPGVNGNWLKKEVRRQKLEVGSRKSEV
jgi:hypothetical protein